ncbi:hypothetical protein M8C21_000307 [Ambrosia artemisiifolia]|uniref:Zinc finger, RING/FYVE/PHD-type n=1 Tax=Ambrosia artemisiifolia TaxID=4212 RepID=A0AAD5DCC0_AMBAR|nr:hypothetical protein M8C21_000307 [Ambrosia artemisiifolia]
MWCTSDFETLKMPKDRRSPSCRCRASPYSRYDKKDDRRTRKSPSLPIGNENEYEEARCPICMEHPHNAVLLLCSSHEKGCRPYMCDTSSRHSNCLDQFRKSTANNVGKQTKLVCPLCRGQINGWTTVNPARQFMNSKTRNCSLGTCDYAGNYSQLREHARRVHPRVRPTDIDPEREHEWRDLENDMEQQDMLNMQFEFDDDDDALEFMQYVSDDIASPIWDYDYSLLFGTLESELENVISEFESASDDASLVMDDLDNMFDFLSERESEIREVGRSRDTHNSLLGRSRDNARTTRSRTPARVRQRSNSRPRSHNRQEQVTTLVEFHELSSNSP